jgi:hypothetical protein
MLKICFRGCLFLFFIIELTACSTSKKIMALKPMPDYSSTEVVYDKQLSFISMPVEIAVKDLQNQTNKYFKGLIYEDNSLDGDNLMMKVYKDNNIVITEQNGKIVMDLPLRILGKVKYGISSFGLDLSDTKDFYMNGTVRLSSTIGLKEWKIVTNTTIQNIQWKESPSIMVAGKAIPITYIINPALVLFKGTLSKLVDDAINKSLDIKPYVLDALQAFSEPTKIDDNYNSWFAMQPVEVYAAKATVANQKITANLGLKAYFESSIGRKPSLTFDRTNIALKAVDKMPDEFKVNVAAFAPYSYASEMVQKNFAGQKFEEGKRSITVNKVDLWGKDGKMIVALNLSGSVNGDFYLTGIPAYDPNKKEVYLDQVDFVLDSKSKLLKIGGWLAHGLILRKMSDACRFSIADQLAEGEKKMATYLNNYEPIKGVKVNGTLGQITPNKVILTPNAIVAMVVATGKVSVSIDGLE